MIHFGNEVVIIGIADAFKLGLLATCRDKEDYERLQHEGVLEILQQIRDAVGRYDASYDGD